MRQDHGVPMQEFILHPQNGHAVTCKEILPVGGMLVFLGNVVLPALVQASGLEQ